MSYVKTQWVNGDTITADKLNHIEAGIEANENENSLLKSHLEANVSRLDDAVYTFTYISDARVASGWKLANDGSFARDASYKTLQYSVTAGNTVYIRSGHVCKFEIGISGTTVGDVIVGTFNGFVTVPSTATYFAVSMLTAEYYGLYEPNTTADVACENTKLFSLVNTSVVSGILDIDGTWKDTSSFTSRVTDKIKCKPGDIFYYYGFVASSVVTAMFYDATGTIVGYYKPDSGTSGLQHIAITVPANADTVMFTSYSAGANPNPLTLTGVKDIYTSPLSLKKWFACGDSFTAGGYGDNNHLFTEGKYIYKQKVYPYFIGNRTNCDVQNLAVAGMTLATKSGLSVCFTNTDYAQNYTKISSDADIVTLWFGINDSGNSIPLGSIDDSGTTTFYGAYNTVLEYIITNCPKAHIGIIVSNSLNASFVEATIAVAKKWGIPYLDLNYDNSLPLMSDCLRPDASDAVKALRNVQFYISDSNHHPNVLAHEYESYFIEKWLLTL